MVITKEDKKNFEEFYMKKNFKIKVLGSLYFENLSLKEIEQKTELFYNTIAVWLTRNKRTGLYQKNDAKYELTPSGRKFIEHEYETHKQINQEPVIPERKTLDYAEIIQRAEEYLSKNLNNNISKNCVYVDFKKLSRQNLELSETLLDDSEEVMKSFNIALKRMEIEKEFVRFKNLPKSEGVKIGNIRTKDSNKLIYVDGVIKAKSDPKPRIKKSYFKCLCCGKDICIIQNEENYKTPRNCVCGNKKNFDFVKNFTVDYQGIVLEESLNSIDDNRPPRNLKVVLEDGLTTPISEQRTNISSKIRMIGIIKEVQKRINNKLCNVCDYYLEVNNFESMEEDYTNIKITPEEEKKILELSKDPDLLQRFSKNVFSHIYGYEVEKQALILQQFGGSVFYKNNSDIVRPQIHILLMGDPSTAKSDMLKSIRSISLKHRYCVGSGTSGVGLTGSAIYNDFLKCFTIEAGVLPSANNGVAILDEFDKMSEEDQGKMHEAMEDRQVTINKANVSGVLPCNTSIVAAANPKYGKFDDQSNIVKEVALPPALISRFDLIFPIIDRKDPERDLLVSDKILSRYYKKEKNEVDLSLDIIRKYIFYAAKNFNPGLTEESAKEIQTFFCGKRKVNHDSLYYRQLDGLNRLAGAHAKVFLRDKVSVEDARFAVNLLNYSLNNLVGNDGDMTFLEVNMLKSDRDVMSLVRKFVKGVVDGARKSFHRDEVFDFLDSGVSKKSVRISLNKLVEKGDIFELKGGRYGVVL